MKANLLLKRLHRTNNSTIGELFLNGKFECYTLEDVERPVKIQNQTAIPKGKYKVIINQSVRFKQLMPLLLNVPNFSGVRIHSGNHKDNTEGCILVGRTRSVDFIGNSRAAYRQLFAKLQRATEIEITIE